REELIPCPIEYKRSELDPMIRETVIPVLETIAESIDLDIIHERSVPNDRLIGCTLVHDSYDISIVIRFFICIQIHDRLGIQRVICHGFGLVQSMVEYSYRMQFSYQFFLIEVV